MSLRAITLLITLLILPSIYANCQEKSITQCIDDNRCTVIEDGSGCVNAASEHVENAFCSALSQTECINVLGCVLTGNARDCVLPAESEKAQGNRFRMLEPKPTIQDYELVVEVNYPHSRLFIDGQEIINPDVTYDSTLSTLRTYRFPCQEGDEMLLLIESHDNDVWSIPVDISSLNCAAASQEYPITNFQLREDNRYSWVMRNVFKEFYIDGRRVDGVTIEYLGGAAYTLYTMECQEGSLLEARYKNPVTKETYHAYYDISKFTCKSTPPEPSGTACVDSDDGKNYYEQGISHDWMSDLEFQDYCDVSQTGETNRLTEYFCQDNQVYSIGIECEYGCVAGVCLTQDPNEELLPDTSTGIDIAPPALPQEESKELEELELKPTPTVTPNNPDRVTAQKSPNVLERALAWLASLF